MPCYIVLLYNKRHKEWSQCTLKFICTGNGVPHILCPQWPEFLKIAKSPEVLQETCSRPEVSEGHAHHTIVADDTFNLDPWLM